LETKVIENILKDARIGIKF